jgi:hypothetical protein
MRTSVPARQAGTLAILACSGAVAKVPPASHSGWNGGEEWVNSVVLQLGDLVGYTESDHDQSITLLLQEAAFGLKGIQGSP